MRLTNNSNTICDTMRNSRRRKSPFTDVSLVCEDNEELFAHKAVLCSKSHVLRQLLEDREQTLVQEPQLIFPDVPKTLMKNLLDFIYCGAVSISKENGFLLKELLKVLRIDYTGKSTATLQTNRKSSSVKHEETSKYDPKEEPRSEDEEEEDGDEEEYLPDTFDTADNLDLGFENDGAVAEHEKVHKSTENPKPKDTSTKPGHKKEEEPSICPDCGKMFAKKRSLKTHIQFVHRGISFDCDQCNYKGYSRFRLKRHILSFHEGVKYYCDQCSYSAGSKENLRKHMKIHEMADQKFPCELCDHVASMPLYLKCHMKNKHSGLSYKCEFCDIVYKQKAPLKRHMRVKHGIDKRGWYWKTVENVKKKVAANADGNETS